MFYYRLFGLCILFECLSENSNKWLLTAYKIGERGGWKVLFKKTKKYQDGYTHLNHFSDSLKKYRSRKNN